VITGGAVALALANGDKLTAKVTGVEGGRLRLESDVLGTLTLEVAKLAGPPPDLPPFVSVGGTEGGELRVYEPSPWKGRIGLSGALRSGNVDASLFRIDANLDRYWKLDRFTSFAAASYGETDGEKTAEAAKAGAKFEHHYTKPFYSYAMGEVGFDKIQNIELRALLGIGAGYEFWHASADRNFGVEGGINALYESFDGGDNHLSPAARGALFYRDVWFSKLKFEQLAEILVPLDDPGRFIARSSTTISVPIAENWSMRNVFEIDYQADPPDDTENLDLRLLIGVEYTF
jgi:putative salt-induced outer membrane protein YdiY